MNGYGQAMFAARDSQKKANLNGWPLPNRKCAWDYTGTNLS